MNSVNREHMEMEQAQKELDKKRDIRLQAIRRAAVDDQKQRELCDKMDEVRSPDYRAMPGYSSTYEIVRDGRIEGKREESAFMPEQRYISPPGSPPSAAAQQAPHQPALPVQLDSLPSSHNHEATSSAMLRQEWPSSETLLHDSATSVTLPQDSDSSTTLPDNPPALAPPRRTVIPPSPAPKSRAPPPLIDPRKLMPPPPLPARLLAKPKSRSRPRPPPLNTSAPRMTAAPRAAEPLASSQPQSTKPKKRKRPLHELEPEAALAQIEEEAERDLARIQKKNRKAKGTESTLKTATGNTMNLRALLRAERAKDPLWPKSRTLHRLSWGTRLG